MDWDGIMFWIGTAIMLAAGWLIGDGIKFLLRRWWRHVGSGKGNEPSPNDLAS